MKHTMRAALLLVLASVMPVSAHETKLEHLQIVHPWARGLGKAGATAPRDVAINMTVFNRGTYGDRLIAVSSPLAASADLRVGEQAAVGIELAAAGSVKLEPRGPSVVLHGVTDDLAGYEAFPVWLTFERAGRVEIAVVVEDAAVKDPSCSGSLSPGEMHTHDHTNSKSQ